MTSERATAPRIRRGLWWLGAALVVGLSVAVLRLADGRAFVRLLGEARPPWLAAALLLQAATYTVRGQIWRTATRAPEVLPRRAAFGLSIAELFFDELLPSAGVSGSIAVARALERRGIARPRVLASVAASMSAYYAAFAACTCVAIALARGRVHGVLLGVAVGFALYCVILSSLLWLGLGHAQRGSPGVLRLLTRIPSVERALTKWRSVERGRKRTFAAIWLLQVAIVVLDAGTLWVVLRALGADAAPAAVFASFVFASVARMLSFIPGGLGVFEAASVVALQLTGVELPVALAATLLYRGLSYWLPLLPGLWFSGRMLVTAAAPDGNAGGGDAGEWTLGPDELLARVASVPRGLSAAEAAARLARYGPNELRAQHAMTRLRALWNQLESPLVLLLVFAAAASAVTAQWVDAALVLTILAASVGFGSSREYRAGVLAEELRARVRIRARVLRDGTALSVPAREVVPGDVVLLSAGSLVPADAVLLEATDFHVNEAVLTGESFPVEKRPGATLRDAPLSGRTNAVFLGTNVRSGTARAVVVATGAATQFGAIAERLHLRPPETEFDRGLRHFGYLLTIAMLVLVLVVFAANVVLGRPPLETLLFSVALAVGLSPELLPAILGVNLARGAQLMARAGVLVRHLAATENLGSMDILCTDKTGTLTEGVVRLDAAWDAAGRPSRETLELARANACLQSGLENPLDEALREAGGGPPADLAKLGEIPWDFVRKRLSVVVRGPGGVRLITKGAFEGVLSACTTDADGNALDEARRASLAHRFDAWSAQGIRVLAVAWRAVPERSAYGRDDERELAFAGFLTFLDRPKEGVSAALRELAELGVTVKLITGDVAPVARHVAGAVGLRAERVLTGRDLDELHDDALWSAAEHTDLFVQVNPNQKERIIRALKRTGHVVGFLGDGVNDAPAMHAADTSLSVMEAVDVAREAADFVLLERDLGVIRRGIAEGRKTFANTQKYVLTTTSANLGNMLSMAAASLFLPFLPLTAGQILLNNFLSDVPAVGLADDEVDAELVARPERWDMRAIVRFMVTFGLLSSLFDGLTFALLALVFRASEVQFRSGWFVESLLTELAVALVVRTRRPFYRSRPGRLLLGATLALVPLTLALPYLPFAGRLGFAPLPGAVLALVVGVTVLYVGATELAKRAFFRRHA